MFIAGPTPAEKQKVRECLAKGQHPAPYLRNYGVSFLGKPPTKEALKKMSIEELAPYADHVIQSITGNRDLEIQTSGEDPSEIPVSDLNASAVGGAAYLALHGVPARRAMYLKVLERFRKE